MGHYLVVAHQTATSSLLLNRLTRIARDDRRAAFTVLVPATHPKHIARREEGEGLFVWDEHESYELAAERAEEARAQLARAGLRVRDAVVGDESPLLAIEDWLRGSPERVEGIVISTLPLAESRWTRMSLREQAERRFDVPVLHICEGREDAGWSRPRAEATPSRVRAFVLVPDGRRGVMLVAALVLVYLMSAGVLAVAVDRKFFVNDVLALTVFAVVVIGLVLAERFSPSRRTEA